MLQLVYSYPDVEFPLATGLGFSLYIKVQPHYEKFQVYVNKITVTRNPQVLIIQCQWLSTHSSGDAFSLSAFSPFSAGLNSMATELVAGLSITYVLV